MYDAKTTPNMFVIDPSGKLIYAGAIDDHATTEISDIKSSKNYVSAALTEAMAGQAVQTPVPGPMAARLSIGSRASYGTD